MPEFETQGPTTSQHMLTLYKQNCDNIVTLKGLLLHDACWAGVPRCFQAD